MVNKSQSKAVNTAMSLLNLTPQSQLKSIFREPRKHSQRLLWQPLLQRLPMSPGPFPSLHYFFPLDIIFGEDTI